MNTGCANLVRITNENQHFQKTNKFLCYDCRAERKSNQQPQNTNKNNNVKFNNNTNQKSSPNSSEVQRLTEENRKLRLAQGLLNKENLDYKITIADLTQEIKSLKEQFENKKKQKINIKSDASYVSDIFRQMAENKNRQLTKEEFCNTFMKTLYTLAAVYENSDKEVDNDYIVDDDTDSYDILKETSVNLDNDTNQSNIINTTTAMDTIAALNAPTHNNSSANK